MSREEIVKRRGVTGTRSLKISKSETDDEGMIYVSNLRCQRNLQQYSGSRIQPLDFSEACLLPLDATLYDQLAYKSLLQFQYMCKSPFNIRRFHGKGKNSRKMRSYTGKELKGMDALHNSVIAAINQYNNFTKKGKLKLERLIQGNYFDLDCKLLYATFYAIDMETSSSSVYQAAIAEHDGQQILGLLRDFSKDKILAVLSVSAVSEVDEDLAVKKENRGVDGDLAKKDNRGMDGDLAVKKKNRGVDGDSALKKTIRRMSKALTGLLRK